MAVLSIDMTTRDKETTWADVTHTIHPIDQNMEWSVKAYNLAAEMIDAGFDQDEIEQMQNVGRELNLMSRLEAECTCTPRHNCHLCDLVAAVLYYELKLEK
jgi:hypothetical protein